MLLDTKLLPPQPHSRSVDRSHLLERLDEATERSLTLISAAAGFGKTSLLSAWVHDRSFQAAWVSLDPEDDEPTRFWAYVVAALRSRLPTAAEAATELLRGPGPPVARSVATIIANDVAASGRALVVVLDDLHVIEDRSIHAGMEYLVDHAPANLHLVVTARSDPPWQLARLRAQGRMTELRANDLRFDADEARGLMESAGLILSEDDVRSIEERTEGWPAGLQMAALSMRGRDDPSSFIEEFAGSHRFVLDYLTGEVLARQTEEVRSFLVETAILDRLQGGLCDAVTGRGGSGEMLAALERSNLFTDALDDRRQWYRYHQLFGDVLRSRLARMAPEHVAGLHARASAWFEAHGFVDAAIEHAIEGSDIARAVGLIGASAVATFAVGDQVRLLGWLGRLPEAAVDASPELASMRTWARFVLGDMDDIESGLDIAASAIATVDVADRRARLEADLDGVRAWVAYQSGDLPGCIDLARRARGRPGREGLVPTRMVTFALGAALLLSRDLDAAEPELERLRGESRLDGDRITEGLAIALLGQTSLQRGRLRDARSRYERAAEVATVSGEKLSSVGISEVQLGEVLREQGALHEAEAVLRSGIGVCERALGLPEWVFEGRVTLARVLRALGRDRAASESAAVAQGILEDEILPGGMLPLVERALCYWIRHQLDLGSLESARRWQQRRESDALGPGGASLPADSSLSARILLAEGRPEETLAITTRLLAEDEEASDLAATLEARLVGASALARMDRRDEALTELEVALANGEAEGYVRLFLDLAAPGDGLLEEIAASTRATAGHARRILGRMQDEAVRPDAAAVSHAELVEPLNQREVELLHRLAARRTNQEIADELFISVNTVKWHARNLYGKLGVERRTEAVARARELDLL